MTKRLQLFREVLIVTALVGVSFWAGWQAYGYDFLKSRRLAVDFSQRWSIPRGYEVISITPTPDTAPFVVGDRIDIFIDEAGMVGPLILDGVVTHQTKTDFGMLVPYGGRDLLTHARDTGMRLIFRLSLAPSDPMVIAPAADRQAIDTESDRRAQNK